MMSGSRWSRDSLAVIVAAVVMLLPLSLYGAGNGDDWAADLDAKEADEAAPSKVEGMTAQELESYAAAAAEEATADEEAPEVFIHQRRRVVVREMQFNADWNCDPTAVPAMVGQYQRLTSLDAQALIPCKPLTFDAKELLDYPFVYMSAHYAFKLNDEESTGLRTFVDRGGFIMADDCLYGQTFGPAFVGEMRRLFPDGQWKEVSVKDPVNGLVLSQKYSFRTGETGIPPGQKNQNPWQGVFLGGVLSVLYTVQDLGCEWEISSPPTSSNPLGAGMHGSDMNPGARLEAYQLAVNVILFSMLH